MTPELARALERQRQIRQARLDSVQQQHRDAGTRQRATIGTHSAGDRVFDLVTGQEGIVIHGTTENVIVPVAER